MKIRILAGAVAALAVLPCAAALAAGTAADAALFGKDPGQGKAYACYSRHYDAPHLAAHPKQNVREMTLFIDSSVDPDQGRQYSLGIGVNFRSLKKEFDVYGDCRSSVDGKKAFTCGVTCDGGRIDVDTAKTDAVMVSIPDGARTWDPDSEDEPPAQAHFGSDDTIFRLDRADLKQCQSLMSVETKADLAKKK
ncbi:MAG TPA: hypothetical protein VGO70_08560 [Arsenicitalea sp.]|jgi:hypothetical protein|nr:hypothetical protein [Arsenicitalea sp.]